MCGRRRAGLSFLPLIVRDRLVDVSPSGHDRTSVPPLTSPRQGPRAERLYRIRCSCNRATRTVERVRSWTRPLGRFHPFLLAAFMVACWGLLGATWVLVTDRGLRLAVVLLLSFTFGLCVGEATFRQMYPPIIREAFTRAMRIPPGSSALPPPGVSIITCESCGVEAYAPTDLAGADVILCTRCMQR